MSRKNYWFKMVNKYKKLINQLNNLKKDGKYDDLSNFEQNFLQRKITVIFEKIERLSKSFGMKVAGTALALLLVSGVANSQEFFYKNSLKYSESMPITAFNPSTAYTDIDGDGNFELVMSLSNGDISTFTHISGTNFKSNGLLQLKGDKIYSVLSPPVVDFTDIDSDGDEDMFLGLKNGSILVYENNNGFSFLDTLYCGTVKDFGDNTAISLADFDDDGDEDLFFGNKAGDVVWAENEGSGVFSDTTKFLDLTGTPLNSGENCPSIYDFDNDGDMDLTLGTTGDVISGFSNNGSGLYNFVANLRFDGGEIQSDNKIYPRWFDFDNDGILDFMGNVKSMVNFYKNTDGTHLNAAIHLTSDQLSFTDQASDIDYYDFDNDGDLDLFVSSESISYYTNNGDRTYTFNSYLEADGSDIEYATNIKTALNDFDNDGDVDILVGNGDSIGVYLNNAGVFSYDGLLSDNNGEIRFNDARPVFGNITGSTNLYVGASDNKIRIYTNNSGSFFYGGLLQLDGADMVASNFAFSDINDDNKIDIVFQTSLFNVFVSATNDGSGNLTTFDTITNSGYLFTPIAVAYTFADVDGDGTDEFYVISNLNIEQYNSPHATGIVEPNIAVFDFSKVYSNKNNIIVELNDVQKANVEIYNVSGKMILNKQLLNNRTSLSGFKTGLYLVKIYSEKGINLAKVIVE